MSDLIERKDISVGLLDENPSNTNKMTDRQFNLLVDNVQKQGITENIVVRPMGGRFRIVSGHFRFKAAVFLGYDEVPCAIMRDPAFTEEMEDFQLVRMNMIHGYQDPQAFFDLYSKHAGKYGDDLLQDLFGFADDAEFKKLITQTAKGLPKDMQAKFKEAAKEVDTIDGLSKLLNEMFTKHGDSLPYGFMVIEYGKQNNIWLRMEKKTFDATLMLGDLCREQSVTMDALLGGIVQLIAQGGLSDEVAAIVAKAPKVLMPQGMALTPTQNHIDSANAMVS
jgi:hypothetical protein